MDKQSIRNEIRAAKKAVPFFEKVERSARVMAKIETLPQFAEAQTVLLYWSMADEVLTHDFADKWYQKKTILLPCVDGNDLILKKYQGREKMTAGEQFGIAEPVGEAFTQMDDIDIIVVPGVAFDRQRNRMGRGRGFYDRLLGCLPHAFKVGVAFDFQLIEGIPVEGHDIAMDLIVTESEII